MFVQYQIPVLYHAVYYRWAFLLVNHSMVHVTELMYWQMCTVMCKQGGACNEHVVHYE